MSNLYTYLYTSNKLLGHAIAKRTIKNNNQKNYLLMKMKIPLINVILITNFNIKVIKL